MSPGYFKLCFNLRWLFWSLDSSFSWRGGVCVCVIKTASSLPPGIYSFGEDIITSQPCRLTNTQRPLRPEVWVLESAGTDHALAAVSLQGGPLVKGGEEAECRGQHSLCFIQKSLLCGNGVSHIHVSLLKWTRTEVKQPLCSIWGRREKRADWNSTREIQNSFNSLTLTPCSPLHISASFPHWVHS